MHNNLLENIEGQMKRFSKGQKNIANFILVHYDKAAYMTAQKLGIAAGVSESTVVRFAFELGYDGYPSLQRDLMELIKNKLTAVQRIEVAEDQIGSQNVLSKVMEMDIEKIKQTIDGVSKEDFDKAVDMIVKAKRIYILGARSALILARFLALYLNIISDNVKLVDTTSSSEMFEQIMRIDRNDVIIGISFPRYSKRSAKAMRFAKDSGANIIAVTDSLSSPIAEHADCILEAKSDMASFVDSLVAPLSLMNSLIVAVGLKRKEDLTYTLTRMENIWDEYDVYEKSDNKNEI